MRVKKIIGKTYFTKGKLMDLGLFIKENDIDCVYINSEITTTQQKNLEKFNIFGFIHTLNNKIDYGVGS